MKGEQVAIGQSAVVLDARRRLDRAAERAVEAVDQRVEVFVLQLIQATEIGDDTLPHRALLSEGLDDLQVGASARASETRVHVTTLQQLRVCLKALQGLGVTLQRFRFFWPRWLASR